VDHERALLTHFLAAIAYRTQKALRDARLAVCWVERAAFEAYQALVNKEVTPT